VAASSHLDRGLKGKLEDLKGYSYLTMLSRRHHTPMAQRNAQLLGRSVDLNFLLGRHLNDKLRWDVETAIQRFESTDCTGIVELEQALQCLRATHGALRSEVDLDAWEEVLDECNESFSPSLKTQGRIGNQFVFSLVEDVLSNFSYNNVSERFVQAPIVLQPVAYGRAPSKKATESLFGPACSKAYDWYALVQLQFFYPIYPFLPSFSWIC
jgi:cytoplasmic FMR1 interacting protein